MKLWKQAFSRLFLTEALLTVVFAVCTSATVHAFEPTEALHFKAFAYLQSGLSSGFPTTYLFDQTGELLAIFDATAEGAEQLRKFLVGDQPPEHLAPSDQDRISQSFNKFLASQGATLRNVVDASRTYTLVAVVFDDSMGTCPPCEGRHVLIGDELERTGRLDLAYREVALGN